MGFTFCPSPSIKLIDLKKRLSGYLCDGEGSKLTAGGRFMVGSDVQAGRRETCRACFLLFLFQTLHLLVRYIRHSDQEGVFSTTPGFYSMQYPSMRKLDSCHRAALCLFGSSFELTVFELSVSFISPLPSFCRLLWRYLSAAMDLQVCRFRV